MKNTDKLITSFDLSKTVTLTFSERVFKEQKYVAITKYLCRESDPEPKPIGGIVLGTSSFNQLARLLENSTEAVLDPTPKSIGAIKVKSTEEIRVTVSEFKGKVGLDIRKYTPGDGDFIPTHKGIRVSLENVDELLSAVDQTVIALGVN